MQRKMLRIEALERMFIATAARVYKERETGKKVLRDDQRGDYDMHL